MHATYTTTWLLRAHNASAVDACSGVVHDTRTSPCISLDVSQNNVRVIFLLIPTEVEMQALFMLLQVKCCACARVWMCVVHMSMCILGNGRNNGRNWKVDEQDVQRLEWWWSCHTLNILVWLLLPENCDSEYANEATSCDKLVVYPC